MLAVIADIEKKGRAAVARLVIVEGVRFPALVEIYGREMADPMLDRIKRLLAEARQAGELRNDLLIRHPHLLLAPIWMGIVNNQLLDPSHPLDIRGLLEAQLDLIFQRGEDVGRLGSENGGVIAKRRERVLANIPDCFSPPLLALVRF